MHVFQGMNFFFDQGVYFNQSFFAENYTHALLSIIYKHQKKIVFSLGAHVHFGDLRVPRSKDFQLLESIIISTPSITPLFGNNPGYTIIEMNEKMITDFYFRHLALDVHIAKNTTNWIEVHPQNRFTFNINIPRTIE